MENGNNQTILRRALFANVIFSALAGGGMLIAFGAVDRLLGLGVPWLVALIGAGVLGFAGMIAIALRAHSINLTFARLVTTADFLWVAASVVLLVAFPNLLAPAGEWTVCIVAVIVADLALAEVWGLRRMKADTLRKVPA